ncbi:hypothetical protein Tco_0455712 [Tanacetum coccineum]
MAEIGCNWARIGPSKSSQSLSIAHKWAVVQVKIEMQIPRSNGVYFITACSYSTDTSKELMKAQVCLKRPKTSKEVEMEKKKEEEQKARSKMASNDFVVQGRRRFVGNIKRNNNDKGKQNEVRTDQARSNAGATWSRFDNKK